MVINIGDIEKAGFTYAIRVAMEEINESLKLSFNNCRPDRHSKGWYKWVEDKVGVLKELKQLLDKIEGQEN
jgi:hypothetical protein